jgi:hypothetical protein
VVSNKLPDFIDELISINMEQDFYDKFHTNVDDRVNYIKILEGVISTYKNELGSDIEPNEPSVDSGNFQQPQ